MERHSSAALQTVLFCGIAVLYLPILVLIGYSFNASPLVNVWGGFSTAWYGTLLHNRQLLEAALLSLEVAVAASTGAVILGTLASIALVRFARFPGRLLLTGMRDLKVKVEMEVFDTGNLWFVKQLIKEGLVPGPAMIQLCMGIPYGVPADVGHLLAMVNSLPENCVWSSFAISRMQMPWVAQSILLGGNVRVGLEDNLYLSRGVYASNAQLVEKARTIIEAMGARILSPAQARERLQLH